MSACIFFALSFLFGLLAPDRFIFLSCISRTPIIAHVNSVVT